MNEYNPGMTSSPQTRKEQTQHLNQVIDRALLEPSTVHIKDVISLRVTRDTFALSERIRRRATWQCRHQPRQSALIIETRDRLILRLYHSMAPKGWYCAWSDGSVMGSRMLRQCGIGGLLMDRDGQIISRISQSVEVRPPFETEIAALDAVMGAAVENAVQRLCVYCDCAALVTLWQRQRNDPRLEHIRILADALVRFQLLTLPRQHNQPANRLAKEAALRSIP